MEGVWKVHQEGKEDLSRLPPFQFLGQPPTGGGPPDPSPRWNAPGA